MHPVETAAFLNHKGGVGKTTSVVNVGAGLAVLGKRVLIVDLDPQGHLTHFLGLGADEINRTIYDVMRGEIDPREAIITKPLRARLSMNGRDSQLFMSVIPATLEFADAELVFSHAADREFLLGRALAQVGADFDYILVDCAPSLGLISVNALAAAQKVFIPVQTEYLALESLEQLLYKIETVTADFGLDLEIGGLIATRFDGRKVLSRIVVETLRERFGALLLDTIIRDNIVLAESPRLGKDIFSYRPRSFGAQDYLNLSLEIMGRVTAADTMFSVKRGVITGNAGSNVAG
jgi:chromosome partitioning protein